MSTTAQTTNGGVRMPGRIDTPRDKSVPFGRLISVELRKLVDTRSGRWLLIAIAVLTALAVGLVLFTDRSSAKSFNDMLAVSVLPQSFLLPILGIMAVTTEWSQRTGLITFTLEPRRPRVAFAKLAAVTAFGLIMVGLSMALAAGATALSGVIAGKDPVWSVPGMIYAGIFIGQLMNLWMGFAFGALLQNTAGAIVTYLFLPVVWSILAGFSWARTIAEWADTGRTMQPLFMGEDMSGTQWAQLGTSAFIWVVLPLALGLWRMVRSEVKSA